MWTFKIYCVKTNKNYEIKAKDSFEAMSLLANELGVPMNTLQVIEESISVKGKDGSN